MTALSVYLPQPSNETESAGCIPNSSFREMPELGHFPHAENPPAFAPHLEAAIRRVLNDASE